MKKILFYNLKQHLKKNYIIYFFAILMVYFLLSYGYLVIINHNTFRTSGWDLGIYDQSIWNFSHFRNAISTIKPEQGGRMPILGDHLEFILILLAPLYWLWESPYCLLIFQVLCYIVGAVGLFYLARIKLQNKILTILVPVLFLTFEGTQRAIDFDFHTLSLVALLLPWLFVVYEKKIFKFFWIIFVLLLLVKISFTLFLAFTGILFILKKDYKRGLIIFIVSSVYYYVGMNYVIPFFNLGQPFTHWDYKSIAPDSSKFIVSLLKNPHLIVENFTDSEIKKEFITRALYSGGIILLAFPEILIIILPILMYKFMGDKVFMWGLGYHYSIDFITFFSIGLIFALNRIFLLIKSSFIYCFISSIFIFGLIYGIYINLQKDDLPLRKIYFSNFNKKPDNCNALQEAIGAIPKEASLMTQNHLIPHLSHRQEIYYFPLVNIKTDYILYDSKKIDPDHAKTNIINDGFYPGYHVIYSKDSVKIFKINQ